MEKTDFQREIEKRHQGELINLCDRWNLDHTGDRSTLIARLVEWEKTQSKESEPVVEPEAPESED